MIHPNKTIGLEDLERYLAWAQDRDCNLVQRKLAMSRGYADKLEKKCRSGQVTPSDLGYHVRSHVDQFMYIAEDKSEPVYVRHVALTTSITALCALCEHGHYWFGHIAPSDWKALQLQSYFTQVAENLADHIDLDRMLTRLNILISDADPDIATEAQLGKNRLLREAYRVGVDPALPTMASPQRIDATKGSKCVQDYAATLASHPK